MSTQNIRDRVWLWGMKVNALQAGDSYGKLGLGRSTMTVEDAIQRTGVRNVIMAGGLPIDRTSLEAMPSAERIICKSAVHGPGGDGLALDFERFMGAFRGAKEMAAADTRIEAFHTDDFSTGSIAAGVKPEDIARIQFANVVGTPQLAFGATVYTLSLEYPELPALLPYFAYFLVPLWHSDQIDAVPADVDRLADLSGGKPMLLCLYLYDFGNEKLVSRELMQRHLDLAERLVVEQKVTGLCMVGTCMMDLDWEANRCFYDWLERVGDQAV